MAEPRRGGSPAPPAKSPGPAAPPCAATVNGRRDGNRVVHLGAQLQAWPEELLRQRRGRDGQPEYLVRWSIASLEGRAAGGSGASGAETKPESISVWMSAEEVCASCPALLGERGLEGQGGKGEKAASPLAADAPPEDASLLEMKADVRSLVQRAGRQLAESGAPESSVLNTIHVLSAYAGIGSLAGAFKEAGALDLLMRMLCHKEKRIRRGAGEMLRALAAHDAGSRAYVLLSLSRQDGIEQHMDFDSRYTLLELFAETTSSEEHCMSFEGIHLPQQIPGKLLFVLVKRYLCVTSLLDKLSGGVEREDCAEPGLLTEERSHVKQEFEFSMAVANLILELVHVMGWDRSPKPELQPHHDRRPRATHSIFQHRAAPCTAAQAALAPPPKEPSTFKTRSAFPSRSSYVEYVQAKLVRGMRVRMLEDYEQVSAGDEGDFCQSNDGTPPVQVYWQALGCTYWVHWHMVEIIGAPGQEEHEGQEKVSLLTRNHKLAAVAQPFLRQPLGGLYSLPYLGEQPPEAAEALSRAEWWELLFFVKKLEAQEQKELFSLIQQARGEQLSEGDEEALIRLSVPAALAPKVLQVLEERCQGGSRRDLRVSHTYTKYALGRGAGQDGGGSTAASPKGAGCRSAGPGARAAEAAEEAPAAAPAAAAKADAQLFGELLEREGLALPEVPEEQLRALGSSEGLGERGSPAELAAAVAAGQSSGSAVGLRSAGLRHLAESLEEEPEAERRGGGARGGPGGGSRGGAAGCRTALLRAGGGPGCPGEGRAAPPGPSRPPESRAGGEEAAGSGAGRLLPRPCPAPPAGRRWRRRRRSCRAPGRRRRRRRRRRCGCWPRSRPSATGGRRAGRAGRRAAARLLRPGAAGRAGGEGGGRGAGRGLEPPVVVAAGGEAPRAPGDVRALLGGPGDGELAGEAVAALERQLCGGGAGPSGEAARLLQDRGCFGLVLRSLELLGAEKPASLSVLRILSGFLAASRGDALPWHECVEPCLASLSAHSSDREVVREVVGFLHRLASSSKDCAVAMCRLGARETLAKALAKQGTAPPLAPALLALVTDCEEHAGLYQKLTSSVLAGCMQLVLGQIEEHRRSQRPISIPLFDVFLRNLCRGSGVEVKEDKCWEKVQVSSNPHRAGKLTDRNPKTYWESNGSSGSHFITVHMQRGVVVREMSMLVASEDSSYMPARVVVLGGDSPAAVRTELNAVTVLPSDSRVVLLENMTRFWPVLQIRVKRCQQGGIDTRVRGIEVLGPKPTLWPVFKEQLCRRTFLSCTARAHAWCQEICRDRGRLLQLFGKLNRALRHEQAFADRFLPDDEAAWALGRTFWEALVTPLVQSITSPDPQGVSPLAWLLSEYLESAELSGHAASRGAVFGSRVRRLTQLLVHVDPRGAEPEEARAAGGKDGRDEEVPARAAEAAAKSSGLRSIWRCWRDVVQRQVQRFLEAAGQAPDLVERYCGLYRRLRAATEELFGRQAAFVLALGRGFAGALLQLPFLTALHVSERFARYLDGRIRELRGAAGSAEPPQRLQQLLEPFAVLGGLELAHPFEHFYRHYLGDRLLAQGPSWLEGAVAEQLGLCFPSRFPQEMLSDLAESEELRQQFGLFQLQERDRRLLELEAGPGEAPGPASAAAAPEVAPEVKVLALSPRCWPVPPSCSMAEPGRFFSAALSSPLAAFADFCRRPPAGPGGREAPAVAVDVAGPCRAALRGLRPPRLHAADVHPAALQRRRAPGVLRLNRAALAQASGRPLRLLPQQRYLRAERAEVGSLERKRNVLCCLITRILKAEKQLHIDNLVFKVVDACQKGELGPRLQFLSFCCHSVDVLSCVLHLLNQGYLRRQEARPHVLEYVSAEPATPPASQLQPQVAFQTVEIKRAASPASAERRQTFSTFR
ncbi:cullin-9-like isoform X4 [Tyto alba]|uniref:cullin-9-like isoform X4 n=1 Tax=Tyto alba TaxID=56313 RepID=UPI001C66CC42|nr:cullin-9-like isoform X4 [Tyto alba]